MNCRPRWIPHSIPDAAAPATMARQHLRVYCRIDPRAGGCTLQHHAAAEKLGQGTTRAGTGTHLDQVSPCRSRRSFHRLFCGGATRGSRQPVNAKRLSENGLPAGGPDRGTARPCPGMTPMAGRIRVFVGKGYDKNCGLVTVPVRQFVETNRLSWDTSGNCVPYTNRCKPCG